MRHPVPTAAHVLPVTHALSADWAPPVACALSPLAACAPPQSVVGAALPVSLAATITASHQKGDWLVHGSHHHGGHHYGG